MPLGPAHWLVLVFIGSLCSLMVLEHASICLTRIAEAFASSPEKLDELCNHGLVYLSFCCWSNCSRSGSSLLFLLQFLELDVEVVGMLKKSSHLDELVFSAFFGSESNVWLFQCMYKPVSIIMQVLFFGYWDTVWDTLL